MADVDPALYEDAGQTWDVDPTLLRAVAKVESGENTNAVGPLTRYGTAKGAMQFLDATGQQYGVADPHDPTQAVFGAAHYLSDLLAQNKGDVTKALLQYNGSSNDPNATYAHKVLTNYDPSWRQPAQPAAPAAAPTTPQGNGGSAAAKPPSLDDWLAPVPKAAAPPAATAAPAAPTQPATAAAPPPAPAEGAKPPSLDDWLAQPHPTATSAPPLSAVTPSGAPPPAPLPAPTPPLAAPGAAAPPIYTAPTTPLIRPPGVAPAAITGGQDPSAATMPAPGVGPAPPTVTPAQASMLPGMLYGARAAANPLMETTADVNAWLGNRLGTGPTWTGDIQRARDAAAQAAFQAQYGNDPSATGMARATEVAVPLLAGAAVGPGLGAGVRALGAPGVANFLTGAAGQDMTGWGGLGTRLASGAASGTIQGGVVGGAPGAATGAVLGSTVMPALGSAANWASARFGDAVTPAIQKIYRAIVQDVQTGGMTPAQLGTAVSELGSLGTVADVGGANVKGLAQAVANSPGPGQQAAQQYLTTRAEGQTQRLNDAVKTATEAQGSAFDTMEALSDARRARAASAYDNFYNNTTVTPDQAAKLRPFIADPIGQQALQKGINIARMEALAQGKPFNPADYGVTQAEDGTATVLSPTSATPKMLDAVKRGYDQVLEQYRDPTTGRLVLDPTGNAINNVRAAYVGQMRNMFPNYGTALDAWAGPSQDMDALSMGRRVLGIDPDVTANSVAKLSDSQKQMYQVGMAQALKDRIAATPDAADATRRIFGNDLVRSKIAAGFGGEDTPAFQNFQNTMNNEATFAQTNRQMLSGSQTAMRTAAIQDMNRPGPDLLTPATHAIMGNPLAAGANLARQAVSPFVNMVTAPSAQTNRYLGNFLFNPSMQRQLFQNLTPGQAANLRNQLMGWQGQQGEQELLNRNRLQSP